MRQTPTATSLITFLAAVVMVSIPLAGHGAPAAALPQAAEFYVGDLQPAYEDMFVFLRLYEFCLDRFKRKCGGADPETRALLDTSLRKLNAVTVFAHPPMDFARTYPTDVQAALAAVGVEQSFMTHAREYEKQFLARYDAVNTVCGGSAAESHDLGMAIAVDFIRFWGFDREAYAAVLRQMKEQTDGYMEEIRELWSPERCERARVLGHDLRLILRNSQLQYYMHPGWEKFVKRDKIGQAATFIAAVTFVFDNKVNPGAIDAVSGQSAPPPR
jgi:hypothetical protein